MLKRVRSAGSGASIPWEIVSLVSDHLDPKTLSVVSCVNKSWNKLMSSDFLWERICDQYYPSLLKLHRSSDTCATFSYRSLYAMALAASKRKPPIPLKPRLSLTDLVFAIDIHTNDDRSFSVLKPCSELKANKDGLFQFQFNFNVEEEEEEDLVDFESKKGDISSVTWNVLKKEDWPRIFTVIDGAAQQTNSHDGAEKTFTKNVLATACCPSNPDSGMKAELRLELARRKITLAFINSLTWRYLTLDDALRYLQCFIPA